MSIYTKGGDHGTTSLIGDVRVSKGDQRVEAYGTVDELSASIGYLTDLMCEEPKLSKYIKELNCINTNLMWVEAVLASFGNESAKVHEVSISEIESLEFSIDEMQKVLKPLTTFTIPGGNKIYSYCNVCRTICRRAERETVRINGIVSQRPTTVQYLNRLSDYLYVLGRSIAFRLNVNEICWQPQCSQNISDR